MALPDIEYRKFSLSDDELAELESLCVQLLEFCHIHELPMFFTAAVKGNNDVTEYKRITYGPDSHNINLKDNQIRKHILVADGFEVVPPRDFVSFDTREV